MPDKPCRMFKLGAEFRSTQSEQSSSVRGHQPGLLCQTIFVLKIGCKLQ